MGFMDLGKEQMMVRIALRTCETLVCIDLDIFYK